MYVSITCYPSKLQSASYMEETFLRLFEKSFNVKRRWNVLDLNRGIRGTVDVVI